MPSPNSRFRAEDHSSAGTESARFSGRVRSPGSAQAGELHRYPGKEEHHAGHGKRGIRPGPPQPHQAGTGSAQSERQGTELLTGERTVAAVCRRQAVSHLQTHGLCDDINDNDIGRVGGAG